ncbi:MAG: hypothetical protein ABIN01_17335 [Ferruginibacter sp.]
MALGAMEEAVEVVGPVDDGRDWADAVDVAVTGGVSLSAHGVFSCALSVSFFAQSPSSLFLLPWHSRHPM